MATTLTTGGGVNLNDQSSTFLRYLDIGTNIREEVWLEPWGSASPVLTQFQDRKAQMSITLQVRSTSAASLRTTVEGIRNQFTARNVDTSGGGDNTITWNMGSGVVKFVTFASAVDPVDLNDGDKTFQATQQFLVPSWTFRVWRHPYYSGQAVGPVL